MSIAELCEAKKAILELPLGWCCFVNPMTGNCKIAVYFSCLPGITGQVDFPSDCQTLDSISLRELELHKYLGHRLTLSRAFNFVRWSLNVCMIFARVNFRPGTFTPFVAHAAILIISLNFGCSRACIGYTVAQKTVPMFGHFV